MYIDTWSVGERLAYWLVSWTPDATPLIESLLLVLGASFCTFVSLHTGKFSAGV